MLRPSRPLLALRPAFFSRRTNVNSRVKRVQTAMNWDLSFCPQRDLEPEVAVRIHRPQCERRLLVRWGLSETLSKHCSIEGNTACRRPVPFILSTARGPICVAPFYRSGISKRLSLVHIRESSRCPFRRCCFGPAFCQVTPACRTRTPPPGTERNKQQGTQRTTPASLTPPHPKPTRHSRDCPSLPLPLSTGDLIPC